MINSKKAVGAMSKFRRLKQKAQKENKSKIKRQKTIFSLCFVLTIVISFAMLVICAINNAPTLTTTIISGSAWLLFDIVYGYAIKNKWPLLFDECTTGRISPNYNKNEAKRKKDNWEGNCLKFAISVILFLIHLVLFFVLL